MNSISYLTQKVGGALRPNDLDSIIPKASSHAQSTPPSLQGLPDDDEDAVPDDQAAAGRQSKEDSTIPYILHVILFVPNIFIVRPLVFLWFVATFPLSLLETRTKDTDGDNDDNDDSNGAEATEKAERPSLERLSTDTIVELDEDVEKLEPVQPQESNDNDLIKSPTSPTTTGILQHNAKLFTFPRTVYPMNLVNAGTKKTLILDLDETLVHSVSRGTRVVSSASQVEIKLKNQVATLYYVQKRPYCDMFLKQVSKWFNLIIFTASVKEYADPVIDLLETERKFFTGRYYRNHCTLRQGQGYIKDLSNVDKNLNHVIIIDNSPISYALHEDNAIAVEGWISDSTDADLLNLIPVLYSLRYTTDVRTILSLKNGEAAFEK